MMISTLDLDGKAIYLNTDHIEKVDILLEGCVVTMASGKGVEVGMPAHQLVTLINTQSKITAITVRESVCNTKEPV